MEQLSERLKKYRLRRKLSQKQVAEALKVPPSTYRDWEYGKKIVGEPYMKLAEIFEVSLSELLTGKQNSSKELLIIVQSLGELVKNLRQIATSV